MTSGPTAVDPAGFRRLMARWATGVSVVTAHADGHDAGLTVNALLSVSLRPPMVLVSLTNDADTGSAIHASGAFGVSFLAASQRAVSERFALAIPSEEKFRGIPMHRGGTGVALLDGTLGTLECRVVLRQPLADHTLFAGEVVAEEAGDDGAPLVFFRSGYAEPAGADLLRLPGPPRNEGAPL